MFNAHLFSLYLIQQHNLNVSTNSYTRIVFVLNLKLLHLLCGTIEGM